MERYSGYIEQKLQDQKTLGQVASIVASYCSQFVGTNKKPIPPHKIMPWYWDEEKPSQTKEELEEEHNRVKKLLNAK